MKYLKLLSLLIVCVLCLNFNDGKPLKVVIDAGHGGKDSGTIIKGISEKDILLAISHKIKERANNDVEIILLRNDDSFFSLKERVERINVIQPDLVLSLHIGSNGPKTKPSEKAYIFKNSYLKKSFYHAKKLLKELNPEFQEIDYANFYVLKNSKSPALNLTLGNLNNTEDYTFLTSEFGQDYLSEQIIKALK